MSIRTRGLRAHQVRVAPFPAKTLPTKAAAKKYELDLLLRRSEGDRYVEKPTTLGHEIEFKPSNNDVMMILADPDGWQAGVDPRREGTAAGY